MAVFNIPYGSIGTDFDFGSFHTAHIKECQNYLERVQTQLATEGIDAKTLVLESVNPAQTITEYAQTNGVDLIVIATHGYSGMRRILVGSVAYQLLYESHVPVLLIRPETA